MRWPIYRRCTRVAWVLVDDVDVPRIEPHLWRLHGEGYATCAEHGLMHRFLLDVPKGERVEIDHINGDRLDNRRSNLRVVSRAENAQNITSKGSSPHRGVYKLYGKWAAAVTVGGQRFSLGVFDDELTAARAAAAFRRDHMPYSNSDREAC